jgi:hypothetical protein
MHAIDPGHATDIMQAGTVARLELVATRWSTLLRDPDPESRRRAGSALQRILWPAFSAPADEWWTTPLGQVLSAMRAGGSSMPAHDDGPRRHHLSRDLIAR